MKPLLKAYIANPDYHRYRHLARIDPPDEVNFWQPSGARAFRAIPPGAPFLFKLKKPHHAICGFGFLGHTSIMPAWQAWDFFGEKCGADSMESMLARIRKYRRDRTGPGGSFRIGCLMIAEPVFRGLGRALPTGSGRGPHSPLRRGRRARGQERHPAPHRHPPALRQGIRYRDPRSSLPGEQAPPGPLRERAELLRVPWARRGASAQRGPRAGPGPAPVAQRRQVPRVARSVASGGIRALPAGVFSASGPAAGRRYGTLASTMSWYGSITSSWVAVTVRPANRSTTVFRSPSIRRRRASSRCSHSLKFASTNTL